MKILIFVLEFLLYFMKRARLSRILVNKGYFYKPFSIFKRKPLVSVLIMILYVLSAQYPLCFIVFTEILFYSAKRKIENDIDSLEPYLRPMSDEEKDFYDNVQNTKSHKEFKGLLESELFHNISSVDNDLDKKSLRKYKTRLLPLAYTLEEVEYISEKLNVSYTLATDGCVNMAFVGMNEKNNFKSYVNGENKIFNIINSEDAKNSTFVIFTSCDEKNVDCLVENIRIMRKNKRACSIEMNINTYETSSKDKKLERKL